MIVIEKIEFLSKEDFLNQKSKELRAKMPRSEVWFWKKWTDSGMRQKDDEPNVPFFNMYIPDIQNKRLKYVIEVDGKIHCEIAQIQRDSAKNKFYKDHGYEVFRVRDNEKSFAKFIVKFKDFYFQKTKIKTNTIKFILRKKK